MLAHACSNTLDPAIVYELGSLEHLTLPPESFDLAYSSLAFHYISDAACLYAQIARSLRPGGHLVFSTEHPVYMAAAKPGWVTSETGEKVWPVDSYFAEGPRRTDWITKGVLKYHRTIATTLNLLIRSGFKIAQVEEFCPTAAQITARPTLAEELQRPTFLLMSALRE
jgi:SAM-dependent methyltransferase